MNAVSRASRWCSGMFAACWLALPLAAAGAEGNLFVAAGANPAGKDIIIRLGQKHDAAICLDSELVRISSGWTGRFDTPVQFVPHAVISTNLATLIFASSNRPGWGMKGNLKDPRSKPAGALPAEWSVYRGLYQAGDRVVLSYSVGASSVLELPEYDSATGIFSRTISIDKSEVAMALLVCNVPPKPGKRDIIEKTGNGQYGYMALSATNDTTVVAIMGAPREASWENVDGLMYLRLPPFEQPGKFRLAIWRGDKDEGLTGFVETFARDKVIADPKALIGVAVPEK